MKKTKPTLVRSILTLFILSLLIGNITGVALINVFIYWQLRESAQEFGYRQGEMTARVLGDYWKQAGSSWDNLEQTFSSEDFFRPRHMMMRRGENSPPSRFEWRMVVTDPSGKIVLDTFGCERTRLNPVKDKGIAIYSGNNVVGYVFPDILLDPELRGPERYLLISLNSAVLVITLLTTIIILLSGIFVLRRRLSPLRQLAAASEAISLGDYGARALTGASGELGDLIQQFNRMAEAVEKGHEWQVRLLGDTAHELRTPVTLLLGRSEMLRDGIINADAKTLNELYGSLSGLATLINEMEELSRLDSRFIQLNSSAIVIKPFMESLIDFFQEAAQNTGIELSLKYDHPEIIYQGDQEKLRRIVTNLLTNALDFTPEKGKVQVTVSQHNKQLIFCVEDSGKGVPSSERERIFDRFYRIEKSRNRIYGGTGLGLTISRALARAHGGDISCSESQWGGACFTVTLPIQ